MNHISLYFIQSITSCLEDRLRIMSTCIDSRSHKYDCLAMCKKVCSLEVLVVQFFRLGNVTSEVSERASTPVSSCAV